MPLKATSQSDSKPRVRLAVLTSSISHFEVPLYRLCEQEESIDIKVFYIKTVKAQRYDEQYAQKIDWGYDLLSGYESLQVGSAEELDKAATQWRADVVLLCGYGWPGAARIILQNWWHGRPQVHRGTLNYFRDPRRPIKGRLMRPIGRFLLRLFNAHHYGGDYSRQVLLDAGAKASALFFVPYSVDTPHFLAATEHADQQDAAGSIRREQGWTGDDHVLLFIAQHNWFKGPDIAMEVFKQVSETDPKARFLVVGSGQMSDQMKAYASEHLDPEIVHFAGFVSSAQTVAYYLASDMVICTSRYETWARMVNEAMLCRRPCLVSQVVPAAGGLIVNGENGFVVESPEPELFTPVIQDFFNLSSEARAHMGESARRKAQEFAYEPYIDDVASAAQYAIEHCRGGRVGKGAT